MAITAGDVLVFSVQREVSGLVFEIGLVEWDDICVSTFVIRVAERAITSLRIPVKTMEPTLRRAICRNIFMTVHTEFRLLVAIEGYVAGLALSFNIRMVGNNFTGHYQRFKLCLCDVKTEHANHQYESGK